MRWGIDQTRVWFGPDTRGFSGGEGPDPLPRAVVQSLREKRMNNSNQAQRRPKTNIQHKLWLIQCLHLAAIGPRMNWWEAKLTRFSARPHISLSILVRRICKLYLFGGFVYSQWWTGGRNKLQCVPRDQPTISKFSRGP